MTKVKLEPGELLVFKTDYNVNQEQAKALRESIEQQFPGMPFVLITHGLQLSKAKETSMDWEKVTGVPPGFPR